MKYFVYIIYLYVILVLGGFMNNNLSEEQLEIKERLERIINIFTYRYIKAGTKSKKNLIASDLISLSRINREYFSDFKLSLSWKRLFKTSKKRIRNCLY